MTTEAQEAPVTISFIEIENTKRINLVSFHPSATGLTVLGGGSRQGKTSVLDAIAWLLGGEKFRPSDPNHRGATSNAKIKGGLSNGLTVERKGKNGALTVTDPTGAKGGQSILNKVLQVLALNLPDFMRQSDKGKAKILLKIIGVGDELQKLEESETALYADREAHGKVSKAAKAHAKEMPFHEDAPAEPVSAQKLIEGQQAILLKNAENNKARERIPEIEAELTAARRRLEETGERSKERMVRIEALKAEVASDIKRAEAQAAEIKKQTAELTQAQKSTADLKDESTEELETQLADTEAINAKVRANAEKAEADIKAEKLNAQYTDFTDQLVEVRRSITALLEGAELPLPDLIIKGGELEYKGDKWDGMAASDQLKVATAIVRKLTPSCGFVLVDKLEGMDLDTLNDFAEWCKTQELQVIGTRVTKGSESTLVIEDGNVVGAEEASPAEEPAKEEKAAPVEEADEYDLCPIPSKHFGKLWKDLPVAVRQYALDHLDDIPQMTKAHVKAVEQSLK